MILSNKKYTIISSGIILVLLTGVIIINILIDPLWYFGGNKLFNVNYSFNERISKVNLFLKNTDNIDCIIFGSSRVTLLNANEIQDYDCFNFSFSDGTPAEFVEYAKYIDKYILLPEKIIVGIDARFFSRGKPDIEVPDFVKSLELPPGFIKSYLSIDSINFSIRTILRKPPQHRYYNENLIADVIPGTSDYSIPACFTPEGFGTPYNILNLHYINDIKKILPVKSFIGYVAPVSAWDMMPLLEDGELDSYLNVIYSVSKQFDQFYDYSVPSIMTRRSDNNYDGHHYLPSTNSQIVDTLNGHSGNIGLALHKMTLVEYKQKFISEMLAFSEKIGTRKKSSWSCPHRSAIR
jgi:hypothetical protein